MQSLIDQQTGLILVGLQALFILIFGFISNYGSSAEVNSTGNALSGLEYTMFQDVQVMAFMGFGLLMAFLKRFIFSSIGFVFLLGTLAIQFALICSAIFEPLTIDNQKMFDAQTLAIVVFISMGAIHGKVSILQQIVLVLLETPVYTVNCYIAKLLQVVDIGGGVAVHLFGAYFGLGVAKMLNPPKSYSKENESSSYLSDVISIIGTLFLWVYWPSFNGYNYVTTDGQQRAVINTYLSLTASCVTAFALSLITHPEKKLSMDQIQNATLAGAVAISSSADLVYGPWVASLVGMLAGIIAVLGFAYIKPFLTTKFRLHDTCGIHNLHGMPAFFGGLVAVVISWIATTDVYGSKLYLYFPARAPEIIPADLDVQLNLEPGDDRSASAQAGYQFLYIWVTLFISSVSGVITGLLMRLCPTPDERTLFNDDANWMVENEESHSNGVTESTP